MTVTDAITAFSALIAAIAFICGIRAWKREFVGKRRIELAEKVLALFYQAKDVINYIRNQYVSPDEGKSWSESISPDAKDKEHLRTTFAIFERYHKNEALFAELYSTRYRFMAMFGSENVVPFNEINLVVSDIISNTHVLTSYYEIIQSGYKKSENERKELIERIRKTERIVWNMGKEYDEISPRVNKIIRDVEKITTEEAKRRVNWFQKLFRKSND